MVVMDEYLYCTKFENDYYAESKATMSFSLLRACKQTYAETRDLAWHLNTAVLIPGSWILSSIKISRSIDLKKLVHVELVIHTHYGYNKSHPMEGLETLGRLAKNETLETLTLSHSRERFHNFDAADLGAGFRSTAKLFFSSWIDALRRWEIKDTFSKSFRRNSMVINTGLQALCPDTQAFYTISSEFGEDPHRCSLEITGCTLQELCAEYGDELWQYGTFCYRDGTVVPFNHTQCVKEECKRRFDILVSKRQGKERNDNISGP